MTQSTVETSRTAQPVTPGENEPQLFARYLSDYLVRQPLAQPDDVDAVAWERAAAGALLLDEKGPGDWYWRVDPATLSIETWDQCVVGQLYPDYITGLRALGLIVGYAHGFAPAGSAHGPALDDAWRELILRRRLAEPLLREMRDRETAGVRA